MAHYSNINNGDLIIWKTLIFKWPYYQLFYDYASNTSYMRHKTNELKHKF